MARPSLRDAVNEAQRMCWDESIGYTFGGDGNPDSNGYDCSAFVLRCLYRAGFNVPSHRVGTAYMKSYLKTAGFNILYPRTDAQCNQMVEPGDIIVMNHLNGSGGHTFFYMEDIRAYTDYQAYSDNIGIVHHVRVEAQSSRGNTNRGDSRRNGTGAYWEVWCHAYWSLIYGYDPADPGDEVYIARWPWGLDDKDDLFLLKRIRDGQFNLDDWTNKFMSDGI